MSLHYKWHKCTCTDSDYLSAQAGGWANTPLPDTVRGAEVPDLPEAPSDRPLDLPGLPLWVRVREDGDIVTLGTAHGDTWDLANKTDTGVLTSQGGQGCVEGTQPSIVFVTRPQPLAPPPWHAPGVTPRHELVHQLLGVHDDSGQTTLWRASSHWQSWLTPVWQMSRSRLWSWHRQHATPDILRWLVSESELSQQYRKMQFNNSKDYDWGDRWDAGKEAISVYRVYSIVQVV